MNHVPKSLALLLSFTLLVGCGGGGGGNDEQQFEQQTLTINVTRALSGYISGNGFTSDDNDAFVGTIPNASPPGFLEERGILTFDLSSIPADATIVSAELKTLQGTQTGTPYTQVVGIIVDHINGLTPGVSFVDFNTTPLSTISAPPLSEDPVEEFKTLDVTAQVVNDLDQNRGESKYRLRGQAVNPLTAGNQDPVDPVDLARFNTDTGETMLEIVIEVSVQAQSEE